jgi:hypothetical protein
MFVLGGHLHRRSASEVHPPGTGARRQSLCNRHCRTNRQSLPKYFELFQRRFSRQVA